MKPHVLCIPGGATIPLGGPRNVVGRAATCDVVISDPEVSRRHCAICIEGDEAWVEELGSLNGTYVNGNRIHGRHPLRDGDELVIAAFKTVFARGEAEHVRFDPPPHGPTEPV